MPLVDLIFSSNKYSKKIFPKLKKNFSKNIFTYSSALLIFFFASVYVTFPLIFHLTDYTTGYGDELAMVWIHNWVIHSFLTNPFSLFEGNLYYPYQHTFAFQEPLISTSLLAMPVQLLLHEPIVSVNFTFISSLTLVGFSLFLLTYYLTKNYAASLLSGILIVFSPAVLNSGGTLQIVAVEWIPLSILSFLHFIKTAKSKFLFLSLLFFLCQLYNSFITGYFILISLSIIFFYNLIQNKKKTLQLVSKKNIFLLVTSFLLVLPVILPYLQVSKTFIYSRDIRDSIHFALQPEDLLYTSSYSHLYKYLNSLPFNRQSQNGEFETGYLGFVFSLLCLLSFWYFIKRFKKNSVNVNSLLVISILAILLSFGPALHLYRHTIHKPFPIILPYTLLYYLLPGFNGFRTPVRFEMLFIICAAAITSVFLQVTLKNRSSYIKIAVYLILFIGTAVEFNPPIHFFKVTQIKDFPKVYSWLSTSPADSVIIEMPIYNWNTFPYSSIEHKRDYYSTSNFRRTVNGYSGFSPPPWQILVTNLLEYFPSQKTLQTLKDMHITYVIVHKKEYDKMNSDHYSINNHKIPSGETVLSFLNQNKSVKLVKQFGEDYVFAFVY